jgi:hypothetical protein
MIIWGHLVGQGTGDASAPASVTSTLPTTGAGS